MFNAEEIRDEKFDDKTHQTLYLVKWEGYSEKENSWEPESNLASCTAFREYLRRPNKKARVSRSRGEVRSALSDQR